MDTEQTQEGAVPELTLDEVKKDYEIKLKDKDARISGLNRSINKQKREMDESKKNSEARDKRLGFIEDSIAGLTDKFAGQEGEEATAVKNLTKMRSEVVEEKPDPDVAEFIKYLDDEGLNFDSDSLNDTERTDPLVSEAISNRSPKDALKYLKGKVKDKTEADIESRITEAVQRELKASGATAEGAGSPSTAGDTDDAFMKSYSEGESDDHARADKILKNIK